MANLFENSLFVWSYFIDELEDLQFGFVLKCRSLSLGEGDGGRGQKP